MARLNLLLADLDALYLTKLADYLQSRHGASFSVSIATTQEGLQKHLEQHRDALDILLVGPDMTEGLYPGAGTVTAVLGDAGRHWGNYPAVARYQRADGLATQLLQLYLERNPERRFLANGAGACRLIGVYSPSGGCGKSAVAAGLSAVAGQFGKSALYMGLESCDPPGAWFQSGESPSISELFYHLKEGGRQLGMKLEALSYREPACQVRCFMPAETLLDFNELTEPDMELLMEALRALPNADVAVLDMAGGADERSLKLLELVDHILLVVSDDRVSQLKVKHFMDRLHAVERRRNADYRSRMILVKNSRTGQNFSDDTLGLSRSVTLQKDPALRNARGISDGLGGPFGQGLMQLWKLLEQS